MRTVTENDAESGGWPSGIAAITLFVEDLEQSKDFYRRAFDASVVFEDANSAVFRFGETLINLLTVSAAPELVSPAAVAPRDAGARVVFTVRVDDVDRLASRLQNQGIGLLNGPVQRPWGPRTASFADPSGHIWEIAQ
jgi:catechol 2,3-dioxygenase-like lactoylglutathione lyase family enzyme